MKKVLAATVAGLSVAGVLCVLATPNLVRADTVWQAVYQTDFSTDPGWTTDDPTNLHWDSSSGRFYLRSVSAAEHSVFKAIPYSAGASYRLEFDLTVRQMDDSGFLAFGVSDANMQHYQPATWYANYSKGGTMAASLQFASDTVPFTPIPLHGQDNPYDLDVQYHNILTYDHDSQTLTWDVNGGTRTWHYSSYAGTFTGIDRLCFSGIGVTSSPGQIGEGYLDNVVFSEAVPEPSTLALFGIGALGLVGYGLRWRRHKRTATTLTEPTVSEESPAVLSFPSRSCEAKRRAA